MLSKKNRLNLKLKENSQGFKTVAKSDDLLVKYRQSEQTRAAVVVPKSIAQRAVDRNKIRRIILESLRLKKPKGEFIFFVRRNVENLKKNDIDKVINKL